MDGMNGFAILHTTFASCMSGYCGIIDSALLPYSNVRF
jgi:hypothetical protein